MSSSKLWEWAVSSYHTKVSLNQLFKPREGRKQWVELEASRWVEGDKRKVTFQSLLLFYYLTANAEFLTSWPWRASGATSSPYLSSFRMHIFKGRKRSKLVHAVPSCFGRVAPIKHTHSSRWLLSEWTQVQQEEPRELEHARKTGKAKVSEPPAVAESPNSFKRVPGHPSSPCSLFF